MNEKNVFKMDSIEEGKCLEAIFKENNFAIEFKEPVGFFDILFDSIFEMLDDKKYINCILGNKNIISYGMKIYKENNEYYINFLHEIDYDNIDKQSLVNFYKNDDILSRIRFLYNDELIKKIDDISFKNYHMQFQEIYSVTYSYDIIIAYMLDRINNIGNMDLETEKYYFELLPENTIYKISKK